MNILSSLTLTFLFASCSGVQADGDTLNAQRRAKNSKVAKSGKKDKSIIVKLDSVGVGSKTNGILQIQGYDSVNALVTIEASKASEDCEECLVQSYITDNECDQGLLNLEDNEFRYNTFKSDYTRSAFPAGPHFTNDSVEGAIGMKFALFDNEDKIVACGTAKANTSYSRTLKAQIGSYPVDIDPSPVSGYVTVTYDDNGSFTLTYDLKDLECDYCGIHIHTGVSCATDGDVGAHYYNSAIVRDLWEEIVFEFGSEDGTASGHFNMFNGYGYGGNYKHAVVVHDDNGRIGCGLLE